MIFIFYQSGPRYETSVGVAEFETKYPALEWINSQVGLRTGEHVFEILKIVNGYEMNIEEVEYVKKMEWKK